MCQAPLWHQTFRINRAPALATHDLASWLESRELETAPFCMCVRGGAAEPQGMWCSGQPQSTRPHQRDLENGF